MNYKRKSRRRFFLLMRSRIPPISSCIPLWKIFSASPLRCSSPIVFLRYVFSLFIVENYRYTVTTVTEIHAAIFIAVKADGKMLAPQKFKLSAKLWGRSAWLFSSQNLIHICSSALNVSTYGVEKSSGYLSRSVLQIDTASVISPAMRCGSKALKLHNTLRCLGNRSWCCHIRNQGHICG